MSGEEQSGLISSFFLGFLAVPRNVGLPWWLRGYLPPMQETWIQSLGGEEPLEKGMATHSSILALEIPPAEESGGLQSMGSQRVGHD